MIALAVCCIWSTEASMAEIREADENFPRDAVGLVLQRQNVLAAQL
jgi:hypothetical protein